MYIFFISERASLNLDWLDFFTFFVAVCSRKDLTEPADGAGGFEEKQSKNDNAGRKEDETQIITVVPFSEEVRKHFLKAS